MVLVVLAAIWAAVLVPPFLQKRRATHPSSSVVDFHQQLAVLQRTGRALHGAPLQEGYAPAAVRAPRAPQVRHAMAPRPTLARHDVLRRRRDVVTTLACAAALTFALAIALGGSVWLLQLIVDAALLGYVAMLLQIKQNRAPANVRYLPATRSSATQQALLRRSAN